jgi:LacI family transcriptional regulator
MNPFILVQSYDALVHSPLIMEAFCRKWRELSAIPIRMRSSLVSEWAASTDCRGVVLPVGNRATLAEVEGLACPVVNYSAYLPPLPSAINVSYDSGEIGELAADHLCEQGYQQFAYLDEPGSHFSRNRAAAFREALGKRRRRLDHVFQFAPPPLAAAQYNDWFAGAVADWLGSRPKSLAVLAANDTLARGYYQAIKALDADWLNLQAIVGIDDAYPVWARYSMGSKAPPLTSIRLNYAGLGETCAQLLHAAVTGDGSAPGAVHCVKGAELIQRESSGGFCCEDPLVAQLARMAAAAVERGEAPSVGDLQARFSVPARVMAERFRQHTGRPLREFILQLRIRRAAWLLRASRLTIAEIAQQCGFNKHADLTERFGKYMGCTPTEYRARSLNP